MDLLLNQYSDPDSSPPRLLLPSRSAAPQVDDTMLALSFADPKTLSKPYDQLWAPIQGPSHPYAKDGMHNHKLGFVEDANIQPFLFDQQHNTFLKFGYAADPYASNYICDFDELQKNNAASVYNIPQCVHKKRRIEAEKKKEENGDEEDGVEVENPASEAWLLKNKKSPWAGKKEGLQGELTEDQNKCVEEYAKKKGEDKTGFGSEKVEPIEDKSTFNGKEERDYQGRSWIAPPKDAKASNDRCFIPKRLVHTWSVDIRKGFPLFGFSLSLVI